MADVPRKNAKFIIVLFSIRLFFSGLIDKTFFGQISFIYSRITKMNGIEIKY
jgi:hypothetical protein